MTGEYEIDGYGFDTVIPETVDMQAVAQAAGTFCPVFLRSLIPVQMNHRKRRMGRVLQRPESCSLELLSMGAGFSEKAALFIVET